MFARYSKFRFDETRWGSRTVAPHAARSSRHRDKVEFGSALQRYATDKRLIAATWLRISAQDCAQHDGSMTHLAFFELDYLAPWSAPTPCLNPVLSLDHHRIVAYITRNSLRERSIGMNLVEHLLFVLSTSRRRVHATVSPDAIEDRHSSAFTPDKTCQ